MEYLKVIDKHDRPQNIYTATSEDFLLEVESQSNCMENVF